MIFEIWTPVVDLSNDFTVEGLYDDYEGLRILLKCHDNDRMCRALFDGHLCYRNIDEGDFLVESEGFSAGLFRAKKSSFLDWFKKQGDGKWENTDIIHYSFYTENDCIEVLSTVPPSVSWLN